METREEESYRDVTKTENLTEWRQEKYGSWYSTMKEKVEVEVSTGESEERLVRERKVDEEKRK